MAKFECLRKCYIESDPPGMGRLYKPGEFFDGEKAPTRSFKGYAEPAKAASAAGQQPARDAGKK